MRKKQSPTRLGILMDALGVSGKQLAEALHVDSSLVSKWKNNHRPLTLESPHLPTIARFFHEIEQQRGAKIIESFLQPMMSTVASQIETSIPYLALWLSGHTFIEQMSPAVEDDPSSDASWYTAKMQVFQGNEGRRAAVLNFLNQTAGLPQPAELFLVSQEPLHWLTEDSDFLQTWQRLLLAILQAGHKIQIIHSVDRAVSDLGSIIEYWLPLYLTGGMRSWFHPVYADPPYWLTIFLLRQSMALVSMTPADEQGPISTTLVKDPLSLIQYAAVFNSLTRHCQELISVTSPQHLLIALEKAATLPPRFDSLYFFSQDLSFITMSQALLEEIIDLNQVEKELSERLLSCHKAYSRPNQDYVVHYAIPTGQIQRYLGDGLMLSQELTRLTGQEIRLTKSQRLRHIENLLNLLRSNEHFELALNERPATIDLLVVENRAIIAWSLQPSLSQTAMAVEPTIVRAFYERLHAAWREIPRIHRSRETVSDLLQKQLAAKNP